MNSYKYITMLFALTICMQMNGQNMHHFFVNDVYQRAYFNPALNNEGRISLATGLGFELTTDGPSIDEFTSEAPDGGIIINANNALADMNDNNNIFGNASVHTLDASLDVGFARISVGHAWKAQGWLNYSKDLVAFLSNGNGPYVGETLSLGPQVDYTNYNEVYLGLQKSFGSFSIGARVKRLSGVETVFTESSQIDLFTSDDIYQLTVTSDYEMNASEAFDYRDINDFTIDIDNYSMDNFMSDNGGWAFDLGASVNLNDKIELSLSVLDIGSIEWTKGTKNYKVNNTKSFEGLDISQYITNDQELELEDTLRQLFDLAETEASFSTQLPMQMVLGALFQLNDKWSIGGLVRTIGSGDRRSSALALNATTKLNNFLSVGGLYSIRKGSIANFGLQVAVYVGPVSGFITTDNVVGIISPGSSKNSNLRAGLSLRI